jgi:microbial collagenase
MKFNKLLIAMSAVVMGSLTHAAEIGPKGSSGELQNNPPTQARTTHRDHGISDPQILMAPQPQRTYNNNQDPSNIAMLKAAAVAACNVNAFATSNSATLINEIKSQGTSCVNELFSAASNTQVSAFSSDNMYAVANHTSGLSSTYTGTGDPDLEALYLFIRAGYFAEYYNPDITFVSWVKPSVKGAIDAFVNNTHFYDNNDNHGKVLQEVIISMDSTEQQDVYLPVVKEWLSRWNQAYGSSWNMRSAVNGIFTILFRGQYNTNFESLVGTDTTLVARLRSFAESSWMINSDSEYLIANAARELGRLKKYTGTPIQTSVDAALNSIFKSMGYVMYGNGDAVWLGAADTADYYGNCADYGICNYGSQLESLALSQTYTCSSTIKIRSQNLTAAQQSSACSTMGAEETYFHAKLQTGNTPIAGDNNSQLQVNIFDSDTDYGKYGGPIFGINTNNGGMYLEGDPTVPTNVPNFVAYEASYAEAPHYVWNLEHEYVHYLDGRFDLAGSFAASTTAPYNTEVVWWSEGIAEYVANEDNNQAAYDTIHDGSTYALSTVLATNYDGFDQDRIYRWGYLAVRFMFEKHSNEVQAMRIDTRAGNWDAVQTRFNSWANNYSNEFTSWTQSMPAPGTTTPNIAPTASANGPYNAQVNGNVIFSSAGSTDSDGSIVAHQWTFGDGSTSTLANPTHSYAAKGTYTATLTVTDDGGKTGSASAAVTISDVAQGNEITNGETKSGLNASTGGWVYYYIDVPSNATNLVISTSGGSGDADLYTRFGAEPNDSVYNCRPYAGGNNETCTESAPNQGRWYIGLKAYSAFSAVNLTASYTTTTNQAPTADAGGPYSATLNNQVSFNSNGSVDTDGTIVSYHWSFGDNTTSNSANPSHTYTSAGSYTATLTVTDNGGLTASSTASVTISAATNDAPIAAINGPFSAEVGGIINFDGTGSYDPDGSISQYIWDFGDNTSSNTANASHSYTSAGTYSVTLTVTDNQGATATATTTATITSDPSSNVLINGVSQPISGVQGSETLYTINVPAGATDLSFAISGGTGDADIYVKFGAAPTSSSYDCRPYLSGNEETCNITNLQAGTYHVMVKGYSSYTTNLIASFTASSNGLPDACATSGGVNSGSLEDGVVTCLASSDTIWLSLAEVSNHTSVAITSSNGTGDLGIEYSNSGWPNATNVTASSNNLGNSECIYITNQSQYWGYLKISGAASGASIVMDFDTTSCR